MPKIKIHQFRNRIEYRKKGRTHRKDGPAVEYYDGGQEWWRKGKLHRLDGPAITTIDGYRAWYVNGNLHRIDGPAKIDKNGDQYWYYEGRIHCPEHLGPAIKLINGTRQWWNHGLLHRQIGYQPAREDSNGIREWFFQGKKWCDGEVIYHVIEVPLTIIFMQLPAYVVLWILEWLIPEIKILNQFKVINLIQGYSNSYRKLKITNKKKTEDLR